jgi:potassium-transporting ATPase KdpC subunit
MRELKTAALAVLAFTLLLGFAYPLAMTGIAQVAFPERSDGDERLIGREYPEDMFQPRPSVTGYAARDTFFNNQGPNQRDLADQLEGYVDAYLEREGPYTPGLTAADIPSDAATTSASGVDPHISEDNALIQANRVAALRGIDRGTLLELIDDSSDRPFLGLAGDRAVNLHDLNAAVEAAR